MSKNVEVANEALHRLAIASQALQRAQAEAEAALDGAMASTRATGHAEEKIFQAIGLAQSGFTVELPGAP